jgi:hypothetical protein
MSAGAVVLIAGGSFAAGVACTLTAMSYLLWLLAQMPEPGVPE